MMFIFVPLVILKVILVGANVTFMILPNDFYILMNLMCKMSLLNLHNFINITFIKKNVNFDKNIFMDV
jgi:hypothetical protein